MNVFDIIKRASKLTANKNANRGRKITPDETELAVYKEKERLLNVKKQLHQYKKRDGGILGNRDYGKLYGEKPINIIAAKNCFGESQRRKDKVHSILNQKKLF